MKNKTTFKQLISVIAIAIGLLAFLFTMFK